MSLMDEIRYELLFVLVALILAYGLYDTVGLALGTEVPVVAVTSGSMEPELQRGDLIVVHGKPFDAIEVGDIIIYQTDFTNVPIIHRVIDRSTAALETKGDNNVNQVKFCVRDYRGGCPQGYRPTRTDSGPVCYRPTNGDCDDDKLVNVEQTITTDQVLGTAFFIIPEIGHLKLLPTCLYMKLTGQIDSNSLVC
jgi:signal peptidase I